MNVAEEASLDKYKQDEPVEYYNAKRLNPTTEEDMEDENFRNLSLKPNSHFDGLPINESVSSVHVPTNVFDKCEYDVFVFFLFTYFFIQQRRRFKGKNRIKMKRTPLLAAPIEKLVEWPKR